MGYSRNLLLIIYLFIFGANLALGSVTLFVSSSSGNDAWSGLIDLPLGDDGPLRTLAQAANILATNYAGDRDKTVRILAGDYFLSASLSLGEAHSNTLWTAYGNGEVRINGGVEIGDWTTVTDQSILARLPEYARDNVIQADLNAHGATNFGSPLRKLYGSSGMEFFYGDVPMTLARYPNYDPTSTEKSNVVTKGVSDPHGNSFQYTDPRPNSWQIQPGDTYMHGYWYFDWSDSVEVISAIDTSSNTITIPTYSSDYNFGSFGIANDQRYFYFNVLEELDLPGEYYINRATGIIYFWPPASQGRAFVSNLVGDLIMVSGGSNIVFDGLTMEVTQLSLLTTWWDSTNGVIVRNCVVRNCGNSAIQITAGWNTQILSSTITYAGEDAINLNGGDRATLTGSGHLVYNCDISYFARNTFTYKSAVTLNSGVGHNISHNHIHNAPHNGILSGVGNNHVVEYNEIDHVCEDTGDVGAFYIGRDWTSQGIVVRYNHFHDIIGPGKLGASAVYFDDQNSGAIVFGNVFYNVYLAVQLGGGRDITIQNNIFLESQFANINIDARGLGTSLNNSATLLYRYNGPQITWDYAQPPWSAEFPDLIDLLNDEPHAPKYNSIMMNAFFGPLGMWNMDPVAAPYFNTISNNFFFDAYTDMVSYATGDFSLIPGSAPFQVGGFVDVPFWSMGLVRPGVGGLIDPGTGNGLLGDYYTGSNFETYATSQVDPTVNFYWGTDAPAPIPYQSDSFSIEWHGRVQARSTGTYTFYVASDDGAQLFVASQTVVDNWVAQSFAEVSGTIELVAGRYYDISLKYNEYGGDAGVALSWEGPGIAKEVVPQSQLYSCTPIRDVGGNGISGFYFYGSSFETFVTAQVDATINFDWGLGGPSNLNGQTDLFSIQWVGFVVPRYTGLYTFTTVSDDGVKLLVDEVELINDWVGHPATSASGSISLVAGKKYSILLQYYEGGGSASVSLSWSSACQAKEIIPQSQLFTNVWSPIFS